MNILLAAFFFVVASADVCPPGWSPHQRWCYQAFVDTQMSWANAEAKCNSIGSQLVGVYNKTELAFVNGLIGPSMYSTWTGLIKNGSAWQFVDGTLNYMVFSMWLTDEPKDNSGGCAAIRSVDPVGLYALPCHYAQPFVCKQFQALCDSKNSTYQYGTVTSPGYPADYTNNLDCVQYIWGPPGTFVQLTFDVYIVESCASKNYTSTTGTITSPGYPANYANNLDCVQLIYAVGKRFVQLSFDVWMVENKYDYVNIYSGVGTSPTQLIAHIDSDPTASNSSMRNSFQTNSNVMTVLFHTDNIIAKKGWSATYKTIADAPDVYQSGSSGQMTSHNYPKEYDSYTEQYFYISAPNGTQISLNFDYFDTETVADYLIVYDSATADPSLMLGKFSGHVNSTLPAMPGPFSSTGNSMTLYFRTDGIIQYKGWSASWNIF